MKPIVEVVRRTLLQSDRVYDNIRLLRAERRSGEIRIILSQGGVRTVEFIEREPLPIGLGESA